MIVLKAEKDEDEFSSFEELEGMENQYYAFMAREFPNPRFKRNQPFKSNPQDSSFNKGKTPNKAGKGGYKHVLWINLLRGVFSAMNYDTLLVTTKFKEEG